LTAHGLRLEEVGSQAIERRGDGFGDVAE
jgi:hypothetical protein